MTPILNNGYDQIQRWKSSLQKLRDERVIRVFDLTEQDAEGYTNPSNALSVRYRRNKK